MFLQCKLCCFCKLFKFKLCPRGTCNPNYIFWYSKYTLGILVLLQEQVNITYQKFFNKVFDNANGSSHKTKKMQHNFIIFIQFLSYMEMKNGFYIFHFLFKSNINLLNIN